MPIVYLVDERMSNPRSILESIPETDIGFLINSYMPVSEIVTTIIDGLSASVPEVEPGRGLRGEAPAAPMITGFRIMAFGHSHELVLGRGIDVYNAVQLSPLSSHMLGGASSDCLLLGCNVALGASRAETFLGGSAVGQRFGSASSGWKVDELSLRHGPGFRLLHAIARTLGLPTTAGLDTQASSFDWCFTGLTMTVDPFGEVTFTGMDTRVSYD